MDQAAVAIMLAVLGKLARRTLAPFACRGQRNVDSLPSLCPAGSGLWLPGQSWGWWYS
jgi:hypothetical protein